MFNWFRKKKPEVAVEVALNYSAEPPAWEETKSQKLLKEATVKKKAGDLDGAIESLRKAYAEMKGNGEEWGVRPLLRLPMYLQEAGRNDEAWGEFNGLIHRRLSGQDTSLAMMDQSIIYDKMRLFLQREKKTDYAIRIGILSYLSWATGLCLQERTDELADYLSREKLETAMLKLLKKAKREELLEHICNIVEEETRNLPDSDFNELSKKVNQAFN